MSQDHPLRNTCYGKSLSKGGLNLSEFRHALLMKYPHRSSEILKSNRKHLETICTEELARENKSKTHASNSISERHIPLPVHVSILSSLDIEDFKQYCRAFPLLCSNIDFWSLMLTSRYGSEKTAEMIQRKPEGISWLSYYYNIPTRMVRLGDTFWLEHRKKSARYTITVATPTSAIATSIHMPDMPIEFGVEHGSWKLISKLNDYEFDRVRFSIYLPINGKYYSSVESAIEDGQLEVLELMARQDAEQFSHDHLGLAIKTGRRDIMEFIRSHIELFSLNAAVIFSNEVAKSGNIAGLEYLLAENIWYPNRSAMASAHPSITEYLAQHNIITKHSLINM